MVSNLPPTVVDLFCGAGGLSLGFARAGWHVVAAFEHDGPTVRSYRENLGNHVESCSITKGLELAPADAIIGGPPCQGFSSAGMRRSGDSRNTLVRVFSELVARHRPRVFVFENVEGFLTAERGDRLRELLDPLIAAGYRIHLRKVNAANYGVPQHRKRVIAVGGLGWDPIFPEATHRAYGAPGADLVGLGQPNSPTLGDALRDLPAPSDSPPGDPSDHYLRPVSPAELRRIRALKPGQRMRDLPEELWHESYRRRAYRRVKDGTPSERRGGAPAGLLRLRWDEPSKAITSGARSEFVHPLEDRYLTLRECARIQTFPDDYLFVGTASEKAVQIGNAVPPVLAQAIGSSVLSQLDRSKPCKAQGALLSFVPTPSLGMSPALASVTEFVRRAFMRSPSRTRQLAIWD